MSGTYDNVRDGVSVDDVDAPNAAHKNKIMQTRRKNVEESRLYRARRKKKKKRRVSSMILLTVMMSFKWDAAMV